MFDELSQLNELIRQLNLRYGGEGSNDGLFVSTLEDFARDYDVVGDGLSKDTLDVVKGLLRDINNRSAAIQQQSQDIINKLGGNNG